MGNENSFKLIVLVFYIVSERDPLATIHTFNDEINKWIYTI